VWPGRLERLTVEVCHVILDAAHNPGGARALEAYVREAHPSGVALVFGAMKDKAVVEMLSSLAPVAALTICTTAPTSRAMEAAAIADLARPTHARVEVEPDPFVALARACDSGIAPVVVAGSIFLIGPVRERLAHGILR
jgi:folylpolyglutamate synthase/dihydropteroate synthase